MTSKVAVIVVNYKTPELADRIKTSLEPTITPYTYIEVDNGYETDRLAAIKLAENVYCTPAHRLAVEYVKSLDVVNNTYHDYYWIIATCCNLVDKDALKKMVEFMDSHPNCVISHPGMDQSSNTAWPNLKARGDVPRRTYAVDSVAMMIRATFWDEMGGFDRRLLRGWCTGLQSSYEARKRNHEIWILDNCLCHRTEAIAWDLGRRNVSRENYNKAAAAEMDKTMEETYHIKPPMIYEYLNFSYGGREFENK